MFQGRHLPTRPCWSRSRHWHAFTVNSAGGGDAPENCLPANLVSFACRRPWLRSACPLGSWCRRRGNDPAAYRGSDTCTGRCYRFRTCATKGISSRQTGMAYRGNCSTANAENEPERVSVAARQSNDVVARIRNARFCNNGRIGIQGRYHAMGGAAKCHSSSSEATGGAG